MSGQKVRIAAIQAEPEWNNLQAGVDKAIALIEEAGKNGANVLGFPEVFIPGYPWSIWANSPCDNAKFMDEYFRNSLAKDSEEMDRIRSAVREAGIFVVLGYSERCNGTLYIAQIKPTHVERAYWGDGQAESLKTVVETPFGKVGGLNCWEHSQTLLRYYEYAQDVDIHVASWPLIWDMPDDGMPWLYHITPTMSQRISQVMAMEGACFVMVCTQILTEKNREKNRLQGFGYARTPSGGFTMIYGPDATELCKPLDPGEEGILYADVDLHAKALAKQNLDIVGHYSRPDLLSLRVTKEVGTPIHFLEKK
ncbi:uncharacterized protein E0L32_006045 [Thyridium curvatum]|uniref:nitrilase n=1 Tax=Thyridium curvatum TaxID=1093900 RepID=A0A507B4E2_9PEZI|nr:uncharacterized protein E0L32_006045 [Thyridium curvatum]TPX13574.1 hypothetical protein E0L32_006045 [Thyridium curvatum]